MAKMSPEEVSRKLAQLLDEFTEGEVHCVVLAAATSSKTRSTAFGMETNTKKDVAAALLKAGIKRLDGLRIVDPLHEDGKVEPQKH